MVGRETMLLETERMILRPPYVGDADAIQALADNFGVARWMSTFPHPYPEDGALTYLNDRESKWNDRSDMALALIERRSGAFMGILGVLLKEEGFWEVGYWLGEPFWGKGYATEATRAALVWAFDTFGMDEVFARHFVGNAASAGVLKKCGFRYTGETSQLFSKSLDREVENLWMVLDRNNQ